MAEKQIVYWRDIPAQVIVKKDRRNQARLELDKRFIEAIDMVAMRQGLAQTDDYLNQWRRGDVVEVGDDLQAEAQKELQHLHEKYDKDKLQKLIADNGFENE